MSEVPELSPSEFLRRWPDGTRNGDVVLLDVREPAELEVSSLQGVWHIPMMQIPNRLEELPRDKPVVVMCHAGGRSRRVAEFLTGNGFEDVFNLQGGIDAWSREIDPSVPRY
ncbi:MAG: sulfurtransferase [Gammaproteobacteria bacterium]|nr:sulfurtransferase [Gammaproteobacteria bacterium]